MNILDSALPPRTDQAASSLYNLLLLLQTTQLGAYDTPISLQVFYEVMSAAVAVKLYHMFLGSSSHHLYLIAITK